MEGYQVDQNQNQNQNFTNYFLSRLKTFTRKTRFEQGVWNIREKESTRPKDNIYIDMQAGRNLLPKLLVADN